MEMKQQPTQHVKAPLGVWGIGFETYLNKRYRMNTIRGIIGETENFIKWCEEENIQSEKTTYSELLSFIAYCTTKGNVKRTINQKISALKHYYNYLIGIQQREENPAAELRIRNQMHKVPFDVINYEELETLYKTYPAKGITGKRNKAVLGLMIYQGVGTAELQAMELKDLKLEEGKIYIPQVSRSNSRLLKLEAHQIVQLQNYVLQVRPVIMAMYELNTDKLFFSTGSSRQIGNTFTKMMRIIKTILPEVKDQRQIRASIIAHWYKTHNTRQVQYMTGHRYVSSTERYRVDKLETLQEQLEKMHPIQ